MSMIYFSMMCLEARMIGSRSVEISAEVEKVRCRCLAAGETFLNVGSYIGNQSAIVSNKGTPCSAWNPAYYQSTQTLMPNCYYSYTANSNIIL